MCNLYRQQTGPQAVLAMANAIHPEAMPVILAQPDEIETLDDGAVGRGQGVAAPPARRCLFFL